MAQIGTKNGNGGCLCTRYCTRKHSAMSTSSWSSPRRWWHARRGPASSSSCASMSTESAYRSPSPTMIERRGRSRSSFRKSERRRCIWARWRSATRWPRSSGRWATQPRSRTMGPLYVSVVGSALRRCTRSHEPCKRPATLSSRSSARAPRSCSSGRKRCGRSATN